MSLLALICSQAGINPTNADSLKPDYAVATYPYLPIHDLEPLY